MKVRRCVQSTSWSLHLRKTQYTERNASDSEVNSFLHVVLFCSVSRIHSCVSGWSVIYWYIIRSPSCNTPCEEMNTRKITSYKTSTVLQPTAPYYDRGSFLDWYGFRIGDEIG